MKMSRLLTAMLLSAVTCALIVGQGCPPSTPPDDNNPPPDDQTGNSGVTGQYIGSERCETCHVNIHNNWEETLHAEALKTLEDIGQDTNATCLPCHTVGYGESGGFVDRATTNVLADVGCESCHGPSRDHAENAADETLLPTVDIGSDLCGRCHTGEHHPNYEEWEESGHANVTDSAAEDFNQGVLLNVCGECHSGDFYYQSVLMGQELDDDYLAGLEASEMNAVECAICHNPHARTGNAADPDTDRDYQLRYPEVKTPTPTNTVEAATDESRFNLCGQCHHSRGRTWEATSRGPHHSIQSNIYTGEMPVPDGTDALVLSRVSVHSFTTEQCATCHLYRQDFQDEQAPAIAGHTFEVNELSCANVGCHPSQNQADVAKQTLEAEVQTRLDAIAARLGDTSTWEYSAEGGPEDQASISDEVKKVRFLYHYIVSDGSLGLHNPDYTRDILSKAESLLSDAGL